MHRTRFWDAQLTRFCNRYTILQQTYNSSKLSKDIKMCCERGRNPKTKWHFSSISGQVVRKDIQSIVIIRLAMSASFKEFELSCLRFIQDINVSPMRTRFTLVSIVPKSRAFSTVIFTSLKVSHNLLRSN